MFEQTVAKPGRAATARVISALLVLSALGAGAQVVDVVKPGAGKMGVDLSGVSVSGAEGAVFRQVLEDDLVRSGWFSVAKSGGAVAVRATGTAGAGVRVSASVVNAANGRNLMDDRRYDSGKARDAAHELADDIVEAVKGRPGIAASRVAMVGAVGSRRDLFIVDADGQGTVQLTRDGKPCLSPAWSPDAGQLYYTSFHRGFPDVYRIDLETKVRSRISKYPGLNAGADVSPDGKYLALTLSRDGNPELYVKHLGSGRLERLTRTRHAAEASPSWSPDGSRIVYVSDSSGSPQLYVMSRNGGKPQRLTFRGRENVSPDWGPDGRIAFSSRREGRYHVCLLDPRTREEEQITSGGADHEEPSWAPNSRHIAYVRTVAYRSNVYVLDTLGDPEIRLTTLAGDWYSPAWSSR